MRKLIMWNLITLDGFFEGLKSWELDWHETVWGEELETLSLEQLRTAGMLVFGRVTYQGMADYWMNATGDIADLMNALPKVAFSRTLGNAGWNNTRIVKENAEAEIAHLKQQPGRDMFIFGSADLSSTLMRNGLIDEYRLCVCPVVLGGGNPLFKPSSNRVKMKLLESQPLLSGGIILRYRQEE